jgi:spore coat polysaccharide biosynthesis predicted glycosyltransferase SpsG
MSSRQRVASHVDASSQIEHILIFLGSTDHDNVTAELIGILSNEEQLSGFGLTAILGETSNWVNEIAKQVKLLGTSIELKVGVENMATRLVTAGLSIGAPEITALERCSLGPPCIVNVPAYNQECIANRLH